MSQVRPLQGYTGGQKNGGFDQNRNSTSSLSSNNYYVHMGEIMDESLEELSKDLETGTTTALSATMQDILISYQKFHEATTSSMLSEETKRQRKTLLSTSLFAYIVTWDGVFTFEISWLGPRLTGSDQGK